MRHEHEMSVWKEVKLAPGAILMPGVISHATDCIGDAQPNRHAPKIAICREFLGSFRAFGPSLVSVSREH